MIRSWLSVQTHIEVAQSGSEQNSPGWLSRQLECLSEINGLVASIANPNSFPSVGFILKPSAENKA
jgi:hypothetical protein